MEVVVVGLGEVLEGEEQGQGGEGWGCFDLITAPQQSTEH